MAKSWRTPQHHLSAFYKWLRGGVWGGRKEPGKRKTVLLYPHPKASLKPAFGSRLTHEVGTGVPHPTPLAISRNCLAVPFVLGTH